MQFASVRLNGWTDSRHARNMITLPYHSISCTHNTHAITHSSCWSGSRNRVGWGRVSERMEVLWKMPDTELCIQPCFLSKMLQTAIFLAPWPLGGSQKHKMLRHEYAPKFNCFQKFSTNFQTEVSLVYAISFLSFCGNVSSSSFWNVQNALTLHPLCDVTLRAQQPSHKNWLNWEDNLSGTKSTQTMVDFDECHLACVWPSIPQKQKKEC